jgi:hypothetical protein
MRKTMIRFRTLAAAAGTAALLAALPAAATARPADTAYALSDGALLSFDPLHPQDPLLSPINGVAAGEHLVGMTARPNNGVLYALGVNTTNNTGTLYVVGGEEGGVPGWPATAAPVGPAGSIAFTSDGTTPVALPASGWALSFSPTVDRLRATTTSGLNFRVNPNTGTPIDGDNGGTSGSVTGTNPDGPLHGVSTTIGGLAYTDGHIAATTATAYTLDAANNELALLNPANAGNLTNAVALTQDGRPFAAGAVSGFAIDAGVTTPVSNAAVTSGDGYAAFRLGTTTKLYKIALATGAVSEVGTLGDGTPNVQAVVLANGVGDIGFPATGVQSGTDTLRRFATASPSTQQVTAVSGLNGAEHLAGVTWRTQTGQLMGVGIDAAADTGTVYRIDPQTGAATAIGTPGSLAWVTAGGTPVDLPASGWTLDDSPFYDTVRIVNANGLNLRARLDNGQPIDGDYAGGAGSVAGINPDHALTTNLPAGATGIAALTYAYPWPEPTVGGGFDIAYALEPGSDKVLLTVAAQWGQLSAGDQHPLQVAGVPLDFSTAAADIPWGTRYHAISALTVGGDPGLYSVNVDTGDTDVLGALPAALSSIAVGSAVPVYGWKHDTVRLPPTDTDDGHRTTNNPLANAPIVPKAPVGPGRPVGPSIYRLKVSATARHRLTVTFTPSEAGRATVTLIRETRKGKRTVRKTYKSVSKTITKVGRVTVTFKGLRAGLRLRVEVRFKNRAGKAARTVARSATVRRR